jgi:hypothetical protein
VTELPPLPVFDDDRGRLIPVDFRTLPFAPQRCFFVAAPGRATARGGHRADCRQVLVLLRGAVTVRLSTDDGTTEHRLEKPGAGTLIEPTQFVNYVLETPDAEVLVLADQPYAARPT